jgi:hypothetical protein
MSPVQFAGLLLALFILFAWFGSVVLALYRSALKIRIQNDDFELVRNAFFRWYGSLSLWPVSFVVGFTLIGFLGAGYQSRFILPAMPAISILLGLAVGSSIYGLSHSSLIDREQSLITTVILAFITVLGMISIIHCTYYGMMYGPLYADLNHSWIDLLQTIISSQYHMPSSQQEFINILNHMKHFGLMVQAVR